jgi:iron complex outermembrane recepter protein
MLKMTICVLAIALAGICLQGTSGPVQAQTRNAEPVTLEEIVVTATRYDKRMSDVPAHVTVIDKEDIRLSTAMTIPDLLKVQPGLQVTDVNGNRRNFRVDIRGFGETAQSNTLVLVDGRRINQADLSGTDWILIPLERVEKIEIIRGGRGSVLFGDNACGGVINIITQKGGDFNSGAEIAAGSYQTYRGRGYVSGAKNNLSYAFTGSYGASDGYRDNSDSEVRDFGLNLSYSASDSFELPIGGGYHKDRTHLPGAIKESDFLTGASRTDTLNPYDFADTEDYYISAAPAVSFLDDDLFKVDLSFRERDFSSFASFAAGTFKGDTEIETLSVSPQVVLKNNVAGLGNTLTFGMDFISSDEDIVNASVFFGFASEGEFSLEKENYGYFIYNELDLSEALSFSAGFRHDRAEFSFSPSTPESRKMDENLFTAGLNWRFLPLSQAFISFSRSFRYPLLDEIFNFMTNTIDTNLTAQTSDDVEVGIRHGFNSKWSGTLTLFRIDTEDEIFYNPETFANENLDGNTIRDGIEASLTRTFERLELTGSYTFTLAEIEDDPFDGSSVPGVSKHKATLDARFLLGRGFTLSANSSYIGERYFESDFANTYGYQDDYILTNARLSYEKKRLSAYVQANNLTDEKYSEYGVLGGWPVERAYYPSPEINFLAGVSISY